jgi:hypothetical protein
MEDTKPPVTGSESSQVNTEKTQSELKKKKKRTRLIFILIIISIAILIPVIIYFFKQDEINKLKEQQQIEISQLKQQATDQVTKNNNANLETVVRVLAWAVRSELTRSNLDQANQYMTELVKIKNYRQVVLISDEGKVLLSTDKKYEGEGFIKLFYDQLVGNEPVKIAPQKNGELMVSAPIMGIDKRLGTIVIMYAPEVLQFTD